MAESLPAWPPEGTFNYFGYAAILTTAFRRKVSGLMIVSDGRAVKKVYLAGGHLIFASSNLPEERLGNILFKKGIISQAQFDESSRLIRETGKKQGTLLVQMGAINPKDLFRGLILQVTEIVVSPFLWDGGTVQFADDYNREEEMIVIKVHPGNVIREGLLRRPEAPAGGAEEGAYRPGAGGPFDLEDISLSPLEKKILSAVGQGKGPADVAASTGIPPAVVAKSFGILAQLGFLSRITESPAGRPEPAPRPAPEPEPAISRDEAVFQRELVLFHQRLTKLTLYQVLDVPREASTQDIKRAYIRRAKEYHPDRFYRPGLESIAPLANEIFMKINEAYSVLSDDGRRREYHQASPGAGREPGGIDGEKDAALAAEQFKKGLRLLKCGEAWEAGDAFRWAVRLNPQNPLYHSYLGLSLLETGRRLKEAEEHLKTAITLDYNNPQYYVNLGLIYKKGHSMEQAAEAFKRALRLDPGFEPAKRELAGLPHAGERRDDSGPSSILGKIFGR